MRIDAHHHLWTLARGDYGWLTPDLAPIYRDFTFSDLAPHLSVSGIDGTILVQAAPTEAETTFLLNIAESTQVVHGVVGWTDFDARGAAAHIEALADLRLLVGLRPMVQDIPDDDWLLRPALALITSLAVSGPGDCCGEATGPWSTSRAVMKNGSLPPKPYWPICQQTRKPISSAVTRRASISQGEDDRPLDVRRLLPRACRQATDDVALKENAHQNKWRDRRSR
jgi:hypothetical protein